MPFKGPSLDLRDFLLALKGFLDWLRRLLGCGRKLFGIRDWVKAFGIGLEGFEVRLEDFAGWAGGFYGVELENFGLKVFFWVGFESCCDVVGRFLESGSKICGIGFEGLQGLGVWVRVFGGWAVRAVAKMKLLVIVEFEKNSMVVSLEFLGNSMVR